MNDRPIVYAQDGVTYYRASSLTQCPRAFIYARQGHPSRVPSNLQTAFDYGIANEHKVLEMMVRRGYTIESIQRAVTVPIIGGVSIIGHIDGLCNEYRKTRLPISVIEVKCLNDENTEKFLDDPFSFPSYIHQASAYVLGAVAEQVVFAIYNKDIDELKTVTLKQSDLIPIEKLAITIVNREHEWAEYQNKDEMPVCTPTSYCSYYYLHEDEVIDDPSLENDLASYTAIQNRILTLTKLETIQKAKIKTILSTRSLNKGRVGGYKFSYSEFSTKRIDTKRAGAYLKEVGKYDEYVNESVGTRLVVEKSDVV